DALLVAPVTIDAAAATPCSFLTLCFSEPGFAALGEALTQDVELLPGRRGLIVLTEARQEWPASNRGTKHHPWHRSPGCLLLGNAPKQSVQQRLSGKAAPLCASTPASTLSCERASVEPLPFERMASQRQLNVLRRGFAERGEAWLRAELEKHRSKS
ncbi:unnamed protein product, partial [Symbiodinium microadriaticum]